MLFDVPVGNWVDAGVIDVVEVADTVCVPKRTEAVETAEKIPVTVETLDTEVDEVDETENVRILERVPLIDIAWFTLLVVVVVADTEVDEEIVAERQLEADDEVDLEIVPKDVAENDGESV